MQNVLKLLVIDKAMTMIEIEVNSLQFRSLGIDITKAKQHDSKRELNKSITAAIERMNEE